MVRFFSIFNLSYNFSFQPVLIGLSAIPELRLFASAGADGIGIEDV
jgi:hypothetical protein